MASMNSQLNSNRSRDQALNTQIQQQEQQIASLKAQQLEQEQAAQQQALEQERIRVEQAAEVERLKTAMAQQEAANKAAAAAASAAVAVAAVAPAVDPAAAKNDSGATFVTTKEAFNSEQKRLSDTLAQPGNSKQYNKILHIKPLLADGATGEVTSRTLKTLGNNQYRGTADLEQGDVIFIVGFYKFQQTIEQAGDYGFILDISDNRKPRLVYYPEALED
jgi:hypothetical protein